MSYSKCFYKTIWFTLSTTKLFVKVHNLESMCLVDQKPQLCQVSQSRQVSQLTICCHTWIVYQLHHLLKLYDHATIVKPF